MTIEIEIHLMLTLNAMTGISQIIPQIISHSKEYNYWRRTQCIDNYVHNS